MPALLVNPNNSDVAGIRIQASDGGAGPTPDGGNVTVSRCYIHNNDDGILTANTAPGGERISRRILFCCLRTTIFMTTATDQDKRIICTSVSMAF